MDFCCLAEDSPIPVRICIFARNICGLILTGVAFSGYLYSQSPAASPVADQIPMLSGNACESLAEANFSSQRRALAARSLNVSPFSSSEEPSPNACHPSLAQELAEDSAVGVESHLWSQTAGGQSAPPGAGNQQTSSAETKQKSGLSPTGSPGHIFWVIPAFKVDYAGHFTPLTPREKFGEWAQSEYDPLGLGVGVVEAATIEHSSTDGFCGYGGGWSGYGKCFGSLQLDAADSSFIGDFVLPVLLHQDPRYFRLGHGSFGRRTWWAISRVFVTYNDSGQNVFYSSALSGTVIAAGLSNLYYPQQDRGFGLTLSRIGIDLGNTALYNFSAEFWPDIKQRLYRIF